MAFRGSPAPEIHYLLTYSLISLDREECQLERLTHLCPDKVMLLPSTTAVVFFRLVASDEATIISDSLQIQEGDIPPSSVIEKLLLVSPLNNLSRYFSFCSFVPNLAKTSVH